ncbi:hypothetical protein BURPS1106B_3060 [Burkholderia pseudomallei 1106b]|uniref:Uncharacterized protein n=1 Tax=Burkholderia pseudomallei (strain 1106a) TaxID=357348 RepID=A3P746_BURP0|nr:hypothetical protein BURPS1106A_A2123 [Burkholderia pseudomallei 1106a]AFR20029.1 hypothetical protein BPC006_II2103 [Burkholderia pseudomallei BPC006]EES21226.1 hypothetical protein BURPS1106B_3060 [Burkholderia pseudomallei 1106b]KGD41921.1 AMP-binding domain protein [Burkholderia pseudomallei]
MTPALALARAPAARHRTPRRPTHAHAHARVRRTAAGTNRNGCAHIHSPRSVHLAPPWKDAARHRFLAGDASSPRRVPLDMRCVRPRDTCNRIERPCPSAPAKFIRTIDDHVEQTISSMRARVHVECASAARGRIRQCSAPPRSAIYIDAPRPRAVSIRYSFGSQDRPRSRDGR